MTDDVERNPSATLDQIRDGGTRLVITARTRIEELKRALDEGRFTEAMERLSEVHTALGRLSNAEQQLGVHAKTTIVRAKNLEEGMHLGPGKVTKVEVDSHKCAHSDDHVIVTVAWEDGEEVKYDGDDELLVSHED